MEKCESPGELLKYTDALDLTSGIMRSKHQNILKVSKVILMCNQG